jgi:uncharacterized protein with HEPN domain
MNKDIRRIKDILEAIDNINNFRKNKSFEEILDNTMLKSAFTAQLIIIGEATNNITATLKSKYLEVNWKEIVGLRNILVHEYFGIVWEIVWDTITEDLPKLQTTMKMILNKLTE